MHENKFKSGRPRVTESDWEWSQGQEKRGERGMWDREDRVKWETEKCMVLAERYWYLTISPMILAGRYWNSQFQPLILWCVLNIWQKQYWYHFYAVFWRRQELSTVKYIHVGDFLEFQTVWCKSICFELSQGGGQTHGQMHAGIISSSSALWQDAGE